MPSAGFMPAYVGLGSNLDDPAAQLAAALEALAALPETRLIAVSGRYRNPPMGPPGQPDYLNAVAGLLTRLPADVLLEALQGVEDAQGRRRDGVRWGPRTLDLDLLAYGNARFESPALTLPHPGICSRPFVLVPLAEVAPGLHLPDGQSVAALAATVDASGLRRESP